MKIYKNIEGREKFKYLEKDGITVSKVMDACSVSSATAIQWLKDEGLYVRVNKTPLSKDKKHEILNAYVLGESKATISARFGVCGTSISRLARDAGVIRTQSEAQSVRASREPTGGFRGDSGAFHSKKMKNWVSFSSRYELARMLQLDDDVMVVSWGRCVDRIRYQIDGITRHYNPDLIVVYSDGTTSVEEIKPESHKSSKLNTAKFEAAEKFYSNKNINFKIVTERTIGKNWIYKLEGHAISGLSNEERAKRAKEASERYVSSRTPEQLADMKRRQAISAKERRDKVRGTDIGEQARLRKNESARKSYSKKG